MQLLEKHNYEFKAQFDETKKLHSLKCELLEKDPDPLELFLRIKNEHLKPLFDVQDNESLTAEYDDKEDSLYIQMTLKTEGVFFEAAYLIDMNSGEVRFAMDKPLFIKNEFVIPAEFDDDLKERIKGITLDLDTFNDERLDRYFSDKYLKVFIDYAGYIEKLVETNRCDKCAHRFKYRLSNKCDGFYSKNRYD